MQLKSDGANERWWLCFLSEKCLLSHDFRRGLCLQRKPTCRSLTLLKTFPLSLHLSTDTHTPPELQTELWGRAVAASFLLQGTATAGAEIIQCQRKQEERKNGMAEQVWKDSQWNKSKGQKTEHSSFVYLKKEQKQEQSWIIFSPTQIENQVESTILRWYKLFGQTKLEKSLNSECVFTEKALFFISCDESTLVVLR